ncbi:hypothetical protein OROMI_013011 [Orobanche minor]
MVFKIRPSQEILKIRDGTPLDAEEILTYIKKPSKQIVWHFSSKLDFPSNILQKKRVARILFFKICKLDVPSNVLQKKRVARILVFKIRPSQEINKIRDGTLLEAEEILTYRKKPRNGSVWHFSSKLDVPSNVLQKKRVAQIMVFKIRPSQEILKIRDDVPSNVLQKKRVARILVFKIRPSQEINKIRDGTPLEAEEILTYRKKPRNGSVWHFSSKLDVPSNVLQKKRVAQILVFKIRPSQEILKIRDGTPSEKRVARILVFKIRPSQEINKIRDDTLLEAEEILTYRKDVSSNVLQKKRVARILVFKIRPSQEINKIRDGTPLEAEEILTYRKKPRNRSVWHFSSKLDVPSNVLQKKRVAQILVFKLRPSQEILKIRDGTPSEMPSQEINKIRDDTLLEIMYYRRKEWHGFYFSKLGHLKKLTKFVMVPLWRRKKFDIQKKTRNGSVWHFSSKLDVPSNVLQKKRVAQILVFKLRPSQEILKIRDGTPSKVEEILTYRKSPRNGSVWYFSSKLDVPSNVLQKKRVARILVFKIRPSQEINKIRDGTPLEAEEILTYRKKPRNGSVWHFSSKLDVPSNVLQKKRVAQILVFKIRPSQEILKIRDGTPSEKRVARILVFKIRPSQEINKIRDDTLLEAEEILTYRKVARILVFKIRPSQEILKIRDGTPSEAEEILTYRKKPSKWKKRVARIMVFKIRPSQEINKIRDGTPLEAEEILTYRKKPRNGSVWHFSSKLDVPSNVLQKKRVAQILVFKLRPSQEILKIRDGTPSKVEEILTYRKSPRNGSVWYFSSKLDVPSNVLQKKRVARILVFKIRPSQEINKICDGTPLEAEEILTYRKKPRNGSVWHFSSKLDVPSNVLQKKRVAQILVFKIRPSQEILKIRDGTPSEKKRVARILVFKIRPSQEILKIRDGTPSKAEEILTYRKSPRNGSVWYFSSKLDVSRNVLQKKRVARILVFKIRPSQEINKIRDGTPLEAEEILTYRKKPRNRSVWHFYSKLDVPSNVLQKKRVARILVFKIGPSQEILKIRDGTPSEAEEILTYRKKPSKWVGLVFFEQFRCS